MKALVRDLRRVERLFDRTCGLNGRSGAPPDVLEALREASF
jgi:hypothetical protein